MARPPLSRNRLDASLARRHGHRRRAVSVLFGCEGETEVAYFRAFCQRHGFRGEFPKSVNGLDPIRLVDRTMASYDEDYDLVACVFDRDTHASFNEAMQEIEWLATKARKRIPIVAAVSQVAFELWILLHLDRTDRPFGTADEIITHIRRYHIADYDKSKAVEQVANLQTACANAEWLMTRFEANGRSGSMTTVHTLIERLNALTGDGA